MRISDWSSDVCSSDLIAKRPPRLEHAQRVPCLRGAADGQQGKSEGPQSFHSPGKAQAVPFCNPRRNKAPPSACRGRNSGYEGSSIIVARIRLSPGFRKKRNGQNRDMKATIERATLLKSLSHVQSVVERRNTIPILSNVLIEASADGAIKL